MESDRAARGDAHVAAFRTPRGRAGCGAHGTGRGARCRGNRASGMAGSMTDIEEAAISWAVTQLIHRAIAFNDAGDWTALAALFAQDAVFIRPSDPDTPIVGRRAILASFHARPPRTSRHIVSNTVVDVLDPETARATSTITLFSAPATEGIANADPLIAIGHFEDEVRRIDGRWLFVRRRGTMAMHYR